MDVYVDPQVFVSRRGEDGGIRGKGFQYTRGASAYIVRDNDTNLWSVVFA
jgi:hypothetical protein